MRGLLIVRGRESSWQTGYQAPTVKFDGEASSFFIADDDFPLWAHRAEVAPGGTLQWTEDHGDEALAVISGRIDCDGRSTGEAGAIIVEAGVPATVSVLEPSVVVHFGPRSPEPPADGPYGPPAATGRGVHVVGAGGTYAQSDDIRDTRFFADSTCESCRITIFYTSRASEYRSERHSHSQDEILYLLHGTITMGNQRLEPGDAIMVAGDQPYGFRSGPDGFGFLNYRRDASLHTVTAEGVPRLEGGRVHNMPFVNDVR